MNNSQDPNQTSQLLTRAVEQVLPSAKTLAELMSKQKIKLYFGIDPTGNQLTLGHAVALRKLQQFADQGHDTILLIGNGTVKIGDPTGKDKSRPVLTDEVIEENFLTWKEQASKVLDFSKITVVRNGDWLDKLTFPDIIKLAAKTTVQQLIERDMFQERLKNGQPIHGHEILYPLLQGYDSVHMNVDLELGGSDQTFNMMMGRTLQKAYNNHEKWVLTVPIINGTDGRKMSKSYNNFISLTEDPINMFGKLMKLADEMIIQYFEVLTDVPMEEIQEMDQAMKNGENPMNFKKKLAFTITSWLHSPEEAQKAQEHFESAVQDGQIPSDIPSVKLPSSNLVVQELVKSCLPEESNSNIRRLIEQSAVELLPNGELLTDPSQTITINPDQSLRVGKRKFFKLVINR